MKIVRFSLLALLAAASSAHAGPPFQPIEVAPGTVLESECRMGECAFIKVVSSSAKVRPGQDTTVEIVEQVGRQVMGDRSEIEWGPSVSLVASCSYARPRVSFQVEGEQVVHNLTLSPQGDIYGFQVQSVLSYFRACHNANMDKQGIGEAINRFGYDVIAE